MKKFLEFLLSWAIPNLFWILPATFLTIYFLYGYPQFHTVIIFMILLLTGAITGLIYKKWRNRVDDIDIVRIDSEEHKVFSFRELFNEMSWLSLLYYVVVIGFLGLTFWATLKGLKFLYVSGKGGFFLLAFSTLICLALLFCLLMISAGKHIVAYSIFYILFDIATAFSFNFIHFYDNISDTQNMSRDVQACEMYIRQQGPVISHIRESVIKDTVDISESLSGVLSDINNLNDRAEDYDNKAKVMNNEENYRARNNYYSRANALRIQASKKEKGIEKERNALNVLRGICVTAENMYDTQDSITQMCNSYQNDKDNFTKQDLSTLTRFIFDLDANIARINQDSLCVAKKYTFDNSNDTVCWAINRLKKTRDDRFSSINKLLGAFQGVVTSSNEDGKEIVAAEEKNPFIRYDRQFESRLLYLSIMLSATIDVLPLLLSIFVAYTKRRKE
ncbi:MAG: hypothetical protein IKO75_05060 [Bacteroidales bacterium]|nr:hypothetical protein [Bacteroidales bacterium]